MILGGCVLVSLLAVAQASANPAATAASDNVAASVDGDPILVSELERELAIAFPSQDIPPSARDALLAKALEQLIGRRLIQRWLAETKQAASAADVDLARQQLSTRVAQRGMSLEEYLRDERLDEAGLVRSLKWQLGWGRFLDKQLTEANITKYFEKHRRDFDGSEFHVAHILFKPRLPNDENSIAEARRKATDVLGRIRAGTLTFAEAVRVNSDSPSKEMGGDIGWIGRRAPMPESFSSAAFALEPQRLSEPVVTKFGVHLVQCLEIKPGAKKWQDVRAQLEQAMAQYLFEWATNQVRSRARVEYAARFQPAG